MTPFELTVESFSGYSSKARERAVTALPLLKQLPTAFTPFLLKEIISSEEKFPAELHELDAQLAYLKEMTPERLKTEMQPFANLTLSSKLEAFDWVKEPARFLEMLSAHLWASHQMDRFRSTSEAYVTKFHATLTPVPLPVARAGIVVIGEGVSQDTSYRLFVKIQREGTFYGNVNPENGLAQIHSALAQRAEMHPLPYGHWCLDGAEAPLLKGFSVVSYSQLAPVRAALAKRMLKAYEAEHFDPEMLRTDLARTTYESLGIQPSGDAPVDHFALTLLTEGSGTQIYSTTFVQWAAREALRRAQPLTLLARYAPRQRARAMDELLDGAKSSTAAETDAMGSLIDGDMGAYYTWLNQQRLPGADQSRFLVWFENHKQAVVISPSEKRGGSDLAATDMATLVRKVLA
jgi:hypothetical protein